MVCLEVLTSLVWAGDWGAAHILEWISVSPVHTLQPVVASLHSTAPLGLQAAAASFVSSLLASVYSSDVTAHHDQEATLANILDVPVRLLNDQVTMIFTLLKFITVKKVIYINLVKSIFTFECMK